MAAGVSLNKNISSVWQKILTTVNNALVYMDNPAAEMLHWSGNVKNMLEAGALAIIDLSSRRSGNESETKAVFIVTSVLHGQVMDDISAIIQSSDFQHCTLLCSVPETINSFVKHVDNMEGSVFGDLSVKMREWMGNPYSTVDIHHVLLFASQLYPGLFFTPAFAHFFPILPCDISRLQGFLRSTGDKSHVFNLLSEVEMGLLPHSLQVKIKMFAAGLSSMFEIMYINEDCYGLGYISKLVASELANMPSARGRRKTASGRASLVLIDRTLDLVGPCAHTGDTIADKIINLLPRLPYHEVDVAVDMARLCAIGSVTPDTIVPGSLAHANDPVAQVLLNSLFTKRQKEGLKDISRHLIDAVSKESLPIESKGLPNKVTPEQLQILADKFRGQSKAFIKHSALLQIAMATINALQHKDADNLQKMQAMEKHLLSNAMTEDNHRVLQEILTLLESPKEDKPFYSLEDIILLLTFVFSLMGDEFYESPAEIEKLKNKIVDCLLSGELTCDTPGYLGHGVTEITVRKRVADAFEKLRGVGIAREELKQYRSLYQDETALEEAVYNPLVKQVIDAIFSADKPELIDIEFKSHGLKDYIKTGFSLFMNVSKPRPNSLPLLVVYVIGGITCSEVQQIREALAAHRCNIQVIIGSTQILKPDDIFKRVFCQDNLFPTLT